MVDVGRAWGKYFKLFSNKYGKIIFRSLYIGMKREKYLINRYNEFKAIRAKERKNPSPDHEGKMSVIENELNRLCYELCLEIGRQAYKKNQKKNLTND